MTKFEEQALACVEPKKLRCGGVVRDWRDGWKLVRFYFGARSLDVDIWDPDWEEFEEGAEYDVKFLLTLAFYRTKGPCELFRDREEFYRERTLKTAEAESMFPGNVPSPKAGESLPENANVILQAVFESVEKVCLAEQDLLHIVLKMQDLRFDAFFAEGGLPFAEPGNVISAVFTAIGVVVRERRKTRCGAQSSATS